MVVHSTPVGALEGLMQTCPSPETLPIEAGDVEWVADLFDTMHAGDLDAVVDRLDEVLRLPQGGQGPPNAGDGRPRVASSGLHARGRGGGRDALGSAAVTVAELVAPSGGSRECRAQD